MNVLYVTNSVFLSDIVEMLESNTIVELVHYATVNQPIDEKVKEFQPEIILFDMEGMQLSEVSIVIKDAKDYWKDMRILLLSDPFPTPDLQEVLLLDSDGILVKGPFIAETVNKGIQRKRSGNENFMLPDMLIQDLVNLLQEKKERNEELFKWRLIENNIELSNRQTEVAYLMRRGMCNKRIADRLQVAEGTVKIHVSQIYKKVKLKGRKRLIQYFDEMMMKSAKDKNSSL